MADLSDRLYFVQQGTWAAGIPVIILFEGWDAAGKGTTIHKLTDRSTRAVQDLPHPRIAHI